MDLSSTFELVFMEGGVSVDSDFFQSSGSDSCRSDTRYLQVLVGTS